ncbi:MAG: sulfatase-like hydrolase/transferase [Kiritimatiellia bacterium]
MIRTLSLLICIAYTFICISLQANEKPNFVYFIADDISQEDIGYYGHPVMKTPNIDRMAKKGVRFERGPVSPSAAAVPAAVASLQDDIHITQAHPNTNQKI